MPVGVFRPAVARGELLSRLSRARTLFDTPPRVFDRWHVWMAAVRHDRMRPEEGCVHDHAAAIRPPTNGDRRGIKRVNFGLSAGGGGGSLSALRGRGGAIRQS